MRFRGGIPPSQIDALHRGLGARVVSEILQIGVQVVEVPAPLLADRLQAYLQSVLTEFAEPDYVAQAVLIPNDPRYAEQWALPKISAPQAWDRTTGITAVVVAIVDTGIQSGHPDLAGKLVPGRNFVSGGAPPEDDHGHGTHVAGSAAAATNNAAGVAGVSWGARLMPVKVLDASGSGSYSSVASGITWAADNGARVINLSLGGPAASSTLQSAVDYAWNRGAVLACAAGNDNTSAAFYPAYYTNCIATAATTSTDARASFSNYGVWVDVAAPGVGILSTCLGGGYCSGSGTSMASPHVAGSAALVWSTAFSALTVRRRIELNADRIAGTGTYWTYGRINAYRAVSAGPGGPSDPTPGPTPTSAPGPTPTSTPTPAPTPTLTPTPTPTPTRTPTPSPSPSPTRRPPSG